MKAGQSGHQCYPKGTKVSDDELVQVNIERDEFHPVPSSQKPCCGLFVHRSVYELNIQPQTDRYFHQCIQTRDCRSTFQPRNGGLSDSGSLRHFFLSQTEFPSPGNDRFYKLRQDFDVSFLVFWNRLNVAYHFRSKEAAIDLRWVTRPIPLSSSNQVIGPIVCFHEYTYDNTCTIKVRGDGLMTSHSSHDIIKRIEADGWYFVRAAGDHHQFKHPYKPGKVTVPHPVKDLPTFVVNSIFRQAGLR